MTIFLISLFIVLGQLLAGMALFMMLVLIILIPIYAYAFQNVDKD